MDLLNYLLKFVIVYIVTQSITRKELDGDTVTKIAAVATLGFVLVDNLNLNILENMSVSEAGDETKIPVVVNEKANRECNEKLQDLTDKEGMVCTDELLANNSYKISVFTLLKNEYDSIKVPDPSPEILEEAIERLKKDIKDNPTHEQFQRQLDYARNPKDFVKSIDKYLNSLKIAKDTSEVITIEKEFLEDMHDRWFYLVLLNRVLLNEVSLNEVDTKVAERDKFDKEKYLIRRYLGIIGPLKNGIKDKKNVLTVKGSNVLDFIKDASSKSSKELSKSIDKDRYYTEKDVRALVSRIDDSADRDPINGKISSKFNKNIVTPEPRPTSEGLGVGYIILIVLAILLVLGVAGFFVWKKGKGKGKNIPIA
jgi:hypothetical protein